ncbi:serine/threonine-protein kinase [Mariniblastus fucicola]|uniref:Serine/threonine-protein kinase PknB n=1 Tax=Mariniblastus fucicola TaxID=980251 RepID=A0A5B9P5D5_9BACT|nr:serine/threonine-protein kinase [Mariniblastus fucicola]QEG20709.1 Serine/threonine-protein kinase PknB [Mariniblastus fucicola]
MENCPEIRVLIQWLNGALPSEQSAEIESHIESCSECHERLLSLTDDAALQPPSNPDDVLGSNETFTNEPHFRSMRERLSRNVGWLKSDAPNPDADANGPENGQNGSLKNMLAVAVDPVEQKTVEASPASTHNSEPGNVAEQQTLSTDAIRIDGFLLEKHIGSGGFAHVYKAWETELARPVAIKLLDKNRVDARNRHRFIREAKAASSVQSPHVVQVLSSGEANNGQPYIAMELVEGETLAQWISKRTRSLDSESIKQGIRLLIQICRGLQAVHDASLLHRDIKPGNIFVDATSSTAKLGDFGLIRFLDDDTVTLTRAAELAGTPAYMSPEQTVPNADLDATSDVYALGATLYQTLTGQPPFRGSSVAILKQVTEQLPLPPRQLNENVSADLETICLKALEKEPQRRYASAASMAEDLAAAMEGRPIQTRPLSGPGKLIRWAKRNRALANTVSLLFLSLLAGSIISTTLWLSSDFHAKRSEQNAIEAKANAIAAEQSAAELAQSRDQLIQSVKKMVSTVFTRKSAYLALSGQDREKAVSQISEIYQAIIDGQTQYDSDLMRELIGDIADATEVNLELSNYGRVADLLQISLNPAEQLVVVNGFQLEDRVLAAKVYNQYGDWLNEYQPNREANKQGTAIWKAKNVPNLQAAEAYRKAIEFADVDAEPDSDIAFERLYADWRLIFLETPAEGVSDQEHKSTQVAKLFGLLQRVKSLRQDNPELSAKWMMLHQRMLASIAKRHQGQESVDYRIERAQVLKEYVAKLERRGEETFWYDRSIAVNDFFIGLGLLRTANATLAKPTILEAIDRLANLAGAYPRVVQFRADLAEALLVIANIEWSESPNEDAMNRFDEALTAFELCLKTDSEEIGLRRRIAHVYDTVGARHLQREDRAAAASCFEKGLSHIRIVLDAPFDGDLKESDAQFVKAMEQKLAAVRSDE